MTAHVTTTRHTGHFSFAHVVDYVKTMLAVRGQRRELMRMDDHILHDIGITRREAKSEASRPAWDVPHFWMR